MVNKYKKDKTSDTEKVASKEEIQEVTVDQKIVEGVPEKKEITKSDEIITAELKRELDLMEMDPNLKKGVEAEKEKISFLGEKEKIEYLLKIAREKGLVFAIQIARKMNEPFLLDLLHDTLAREGYFKDFMPGSKPSDDDQQTVQPTTNNNKTTDDK